MSRHSGEGGGGEGKWERREGEGGGEGKGERREGGRHQSQNGFIKTKI